MRQAQLASSIRDSDDVDPMCAYHNICFWRDSPPVLHETSVPRKVWMDVVSQLSCRLLVHAVHPKHRSLSTPGLLMGTAEDVETDTVDSCQRLIDSLYDRYNQGTSSGGFIDAYDALSAAVVLTCLAKRLGRQEPRHLAQVLESINKASSVVAQISGRFPALRDYRELLFTLSGRVMEEHGGKTEVSHPKLSQAAIPLILRSHL